MTEDEARRLVERRVRAWSEDENQELGFAIELKPELCFIGEALLHLGRAQASQAEIGCGFLPEHRGRGLGTEVVAALMRSAFDELGLHRVFVLCDVDNQAANALALGLGMKLEGVFRDNSLRGGRWRDERIYSLLAPEWREARPRISKLLE